MRRLRIGEQPSKRFAASATLVAAGALGVLASMAIAGCGGGNPTAGKTIPTAVLTGVTATVGDTETTASVETAPITTTDDSNSGPVVVTVTATETLPGEPVTVTTPPQVVTVTAPAETVTTTTPAQTVTATAPTQTTTVTETATVSNSAAAAAAGAAVANSQSQTDESLTSDEWGWIAFGVLLLVVVSGGIVWLVRRRSATT